MAKVLQKVQADKRFKTKEYIVMSYANLQSDIAKGNGQYLETLYSTLSIPEATRTEALKLIKSISISTNDIAVFADKLIEQFMNP